MSRILVVVDRPGWAQETIAARLVRGFPEHAIEIAPVQDLPTGRFDLAVLLDWLADVEVRHKRGLAVDRTVGAVFDHLTWSSTLGLKLLPKYAARWAAIGYATGGLRQEIERATNPLPPGFIVEDAVDTDRFVACALPAVFTVGWAGRPTVGGDRYEDFKGLEFLRRVCAVVDVPLRVATDLPAAAMPAWYGAVSVQACASPSEGGPNPILEAMACGRPFVSTSVGLVPQFGPLGGVICPRLEGAWVSALRRLAQLPPSVLAVWGERARAVALEHDWRRKIGQWRKLLDRGLQGDAAAC